MKTLNHNVLQARKHKRKRFESEDVGKSID
jgi:hypothetical protein